MSLTIIFFRTYAQDDIVRHQNRDGEVPRDATDHHLACGDDRRAVCALCRGRVSSEEHDACPCHLFASVCHAVCHRAPYGVVALSFFFVRDAYVLVRFCHDDDVPLRVVSKFCAETAPNRDSPR